MVERGQGVRLAPTELGRHVEDGGRLDLDAGQAPKHLGREVDQARREMRAFEELPRVRVVRRGTPLANVVEMDRELGGVQWPVLTEVLPGRDDLIPGFHSSHQTVSSGSASRQNPSPFLRASTPSTQRFSSHAPGYSADNDCASFQNRASRPTPSSTRNCLRASPRLTANRTIA